MLGEISNSIICEICGGAHPIDEHKELETGESQQESSKSDYVEDNQEAVAKGRELFSRYHELEKADKLEEALAVLNEDKFVVAAFLAARAQENSKGLIWVPIKIDAVEKKYKLDPEIRRLRRGRRGYHTWLSKGAAASTTPFAPWVQKMYEKDRLLHRGKEMANFTGEDRLQEYIDDLKRRVRKSY